MQSPTHLFDDTIMTDNVNFVYSVNSNMTKFLCEFSSWFADDTQHTNGLKHVKFCKEVIDNENYMHKKSH
jgi:hypothetical protein